MDDFSTDALAAADAVSEVRPDVLVMVAASSKGRKPGVYVEEVEIGEPRSALEALEDVRPSLEGWLSVDALLRGLRVFLEHKPPRLLLVECEEGTPDCSEEILRTLVPLLRRLAYESGSSGGR